MDISNSEEQSWKSDTRGLTRRNFLNVSELLTFHLQLLTASEAVILS